MPTPKLPLIFVGAAAAIVAACTAPSMPEAPDGAKFYAANCVSCHGMPGQGDGPLAAGLNPAPADLTLLARENGGSFPRARALSYIYGDPEKSHLARVMPQFGGAMADDTVPVEVDGVLTPTPRVLAGLLAYLESIQR
ncbi:c-type cytochrome [Sulfitobacter delicatus]|uniref:Cytochrome c n=1 Tax=Sulfitobacter delicatus TaxID=218672 RepID=A0A1G7LR80_9RHOB|nr:cytochrome c [Sulfitobacter delicatus]SDF51995.1 Cytochrome c [Sulfitobacter delicatus]